VRKTCAPALDIHGVYSQVQPTSISSLKYLWWAPEILFISARVMFWPFKVILIAIESAYVTSY